MALPLFHFHFGRNNSYLLLTPQGTFSQGMPESQIEYLTLSAMNASQPRTSYGIGNTFITVNPTGQVFFRLDGQYSMLEQALRTRPTPIEMVALNPHAPDSFVIVYKHGAGYLCRLPPAYQATVVAAVCQGMFAMQHIQQMQQAQSSQGLMNLISSRL